MRPSQILAAQRAQIQATLRQFPVSNPRIFGSVLHGDDHEGSDIDLLVDALPQTTLLDLGGLEIALQDLLGVAVQVLTPTDLPPSFRAQVLSEARPL